MYDLHHAVFNKLLFSSFQGIDHYEAKQKYPDIIKKLEELDREISGGTTATVVLIYNNRLYVANVGE